MSDARAATASSKSNLVRCELIVTGRCNFRCPYCRSVGGPDLPVEQARSTIEMWLKYRLENIRFSGGEPTLYKGLGELVTQAKEGGVKRIAVSSNGATSWRIYEDLLTKGASDFSISLDACNEEEGDRMAGNRPGAFRHVVDNIRKLTSRTYVTVGIVLTENNVRKTEEIIRFADTLGVSDIRIIPAAQYSSRLPPLNLEEHILEKYPILSYRHKNITAGKTVRGFDLGDSAKCALVLDDMIVMGREHFPCVIYMREGGKPIGTVGPHMRNERHRWSVEHDCSRDSICSTNCLDVCRDYNNAWNDMYG